MTTSDKAKSHLPLNPARRLRQYGLPAVLLALLCAAFFWDALWLPGRIRARRQRPDQHVRPLAALCEDVDPTRTAAAVESHPLFRHALCRQSATRIVLSPHLAGVAHDAHARAGVEPRVSRLAGRYGDGRLAAIGSGLRSRSIPGRGRVRLQRLHLHPHPGRARGTVQHRRVAAADFVDGKARPRTSFVAVGDPRWLAGGGGVSRRTHRHLHLRRADARPLPGVLCLARHTRPSSDAKNPAADAGCDDRSSAWD